MQYLICDNITTIRSEDFIDVPFHCIVGTLPDETIVLITYSGTATCRLEFDPANLKNCGTFNILETMFRNTASYKVDELKLRKFANKVDDILKFNNILSIYSRYQPGEIDLKDKLETIMLQNNYVYEEEDFENIVLRGIITFSR